MPAASTSAVTGSRTPAIEWNEAEAPFHTVGRLTLEAGVAVARRCLQRDAHRRHEEFAARESAARQHQSRAMGRGKGQPRGAARPGAGAGAVAAAARRSPSPLRRGSERRRRAGRPGGPLGAGAVSRRNSAAVGVDRVLHPHRSWRAAGRKERDGRVPDQGWGAGADAPGRQAYYYTPQGASIKDLRYRWFINLELPLSKTRLASPEVMRRYGLLVDEKSAANPDQLPVGFGKAFDPALNEDCSTSPARPVTPGRSTSPRTAVRRRCASTAAPHCTPSPIRASATSARRCCRSLLARPRTR